MFVENTFQDHLLENDDLLESPQNLEDLKNDLIESDPDSNPNNIESEPSNEPQNNEGNDLYEELGIFEAFLASKGIRDGKTLVYEGENGELEEIDFNSLDREEQFNILNELTKPNLTESEIAAIEYLRENKSTLKEVVDHFSKKAVEDYIAQNGPVEKTYSVDDYSDDELYIADLKSKYPDMSDEELDSDLELAKTNEELFKKKTEIIRNNYKALEDKAIEDEKTAKENQYNDFKTTITNHLNEFNEISLDYKDDKSDSLQIEDSEKEAIFKYILERDEEGATKLFKDLSDPKVLVDLAWYRLFGKDAISGISQYWKSVVKESRKTQEPVQTPPAKQTKTTQRTHVIPTKEERNKLNGDRTIHSLWGDKI